MPTPKPIQSIALPFTGKKALWRDGEIEVKLRRSRLAPLLTGAALVFAGGISAEPLVITPDSEDLIVGQRQSGAPLTNGYHENPSQSLGVGIPGAAGSRYHRNAVIGFELPVLNPGEVIDDASFQITITSNNTVGGAKPVALYGLSTANPQNTGTSLFSTDTESGTTANMTHPLISATFASTGDSSGSPSADVTEFIRSFYTGNVPHRSEVFFRISPTEDMWPSVNRLDFTKGSARLEVTTAPGPETLYTRIGTDPSFEELIDAGIIVPGVSSQTNTVPGSTVYINQPMFEELAGSSGPVPGAIRMHNQVNPSVLNQNFSRYPRWYREDGNVQVKRLFEGEQNARFGIGEDGSPGRIETFFTPFTIQPGTWSVWEGTYTFVEPLGSTIFQLFHEGGQLWAFHLRMRTDGTITFNRRNNIPGLPRNIIIATDMTGKSIRFRVRSDGHNYELYKKVPFEDEDWELVTTGRYTPAVDNRISLRWGMYVGSQSGQSVSRDGMMFVSGVSRTTSTEPGVAPPDPPPPVTKYWDGNGAAAGFGNAGGVWSDPTIGSTTQGWSTDATGGTLPDDLSTFVLDPVFFGTNTAGRGLGTGTITVDGTVSCADITFGSQSGNITLTGGEIFQGGDRVITVAGSGDTQTIHSELSGFGTRTIGGQGTLELYGENTFTEALTIGDNTNTLRLRFNTIADVDGGPSSLGAPVTAGNGIIQIGAVSRTSTFEFANATAAQSTNRRIRIGSDSNGSGGATILNNNANPAHTLEFTNSSFNVAATGISNTNRTLTLGGSNTGDNIIHGNIVNNVGTTGGRLALTKTGGGKWVLKGANTYTNATNVNQGTLALVGASLTSTVNVASGARLGFTLGEPSSTTSTANLGNATIQITGTPAEGTDYLLFTADEGINGMPALAGVFPDHELEVRDGGGTLHLAYIEPPAPDYPSWAAENVGGQGPAEDFDGDGVPNGIEFFFNSAPGFTALPMLDANNTVTWPNGGNIPASEYGTAFVLQTSGDLVNWTDVPVGDLDENTGEIGTPGNLTYTLQGPAPRFVRLRVTIE